MLNQIDLSRADLNLLVLFAAVLEERHVGRAAERMSLSPSAVSHGLRRLRRLLNDPLFLKTPKGVVATARALELAEPIAEILARAGQVIASARPFEPAHSRRRFVIGAPDGIAAVFLPPLLARLGRTAPGIDIGARQLFPLHSPAELDARLVDIALVPLEEVPARFAAIDFYDEPFVIGARAGHPFLAEPTLERYCAEQHLLVSVSGDARGYIDEELAARGLARRVALTVPSFMLALAVIAETGLIGALPRQMAALHGPRYGVESVPPPLALQRATVRALVPKAALMDAGLAWLIDVLREIMPTEAQRTIVQDETACARHESTLR
jgi:DNA-binding transcriptional LysR family regulator